LLASFAFFTDHCVAQGTTAQQIESLQRQIDQLRLETGLPYQTARLWDDLPPSNQGGASVPKSEPVPTPPPAPKAEEKKYPDFKLTGFFQLDSAYFGQSGESVATLGDIQDGTGFRRARLAATGNISERASYMMEFDMAQAQARFVDVWGQFKDTPWGTLRVGRFRQPFGMSELTSVRELDLMERPSVFAMSPFRQTGIMLSDNTENERLTWAVSGFRTISDNFGNVFGDDGGFGTAERLTTLLVDQGDCGLVHIGFDHSYLDPARNQLQIASQDEIFVGQQPNLGPTGLSVLPIVNVPPFVNTGPFNVQDANLFNVEAAASVGQALIQSEYRWSNISLPTGENATVHGGYTTLRYVLTGETIPYNRTTGVFGRIKPNRPIDVCRGDWGALELVGRFSTIDLNPLFSLPGVTGPCRRLNSTSVGLNWYLLPNAKCQFEWVNGSLNDPVLGQSITNTFASRVQFDF
jgi:phosphate-selective porin OprO/OprP